MEVAALNADLRAEEAAAAAAARRAEAKAQAQAQALNADLRAEEAAAAAAAKRAEAKASAQAQAQGGAEVGSAAESEAGARSGAVLGEEPKLSRLERRRAKIRAEIERNRRGDYKVPTWVLAVALVVFVAGWAALIVFA
ncbi:hypothetical protein AB0I28_18370 [Phytomonospora sp. NPDC050363]|uniref:hypothetical protein n=1 Tax=Phytomonospora sp. NPDC050363 TaxID=3155642 RepID=UPI0033DC4868